MKCQIPQISWHSRDPVLSIDFQSNQNSFYRLASGGTDSHVLIWFVTFNENKTLTIECASDLYRHNKSVNVVRFAPDGEILASGDDEGAIFLWKLKDRDQAELPNDEENTNKEDWYPLKLLRGHLEDVYDLSWSKDGNLLVSASMDNTAIVWDIQKFQKLHIFSDFKGYVQGIALDPLNQFIASLGSDRALRIHNINSKKVLYKVQKAPWSVTTEKGSNKARLFYDDTLQSYCRRLAFTPDGELLIAPSGICEKDDKFRNTTYVFSRHCLNKPALHLPSGDKYTIAVRCNPLLFELRSINLTEDKENELSLNKNKPMIDLPYRMIIAVAASDSILMYDTQQLLPFAFVSNIHYTHLTDLSWSSDGRLLVASSTDGYCSFIVFSEDELGKIYVPKTPPRAEIPKQKLCSNNNQVSEKKIDEVELVEMPDSRNANANKIEKNVAPELKKIATEKKTPISSPVAKLLTPKSSKEPLDESNVSKSGKKTEKIRSIKSFFVSPAQKVLLKTEKSDNKDLEEKSTISNNKERDMDACCIDITSPKAFKSNNRNYSELKNCSVHLIDCLKAINCEESHTPMKSLENPALIAIEDAMDFEDSEKISEVQFADSTRKSSKCSINFDSSFISEMNKPLENVNKRSISKVNENPFNEASAVREPGNSGLNTFEPDDWKLELTSDGTTQDIEMDHSDVPPCNKNSSVVTSSDNTGKESAPKRRIQLITLSSKTSLK